MKRRSFLATLLAAPAIVRAESLMPIWVPNLKIALPDAIVLWGDGIRDDTQALQEWFSGMPVIWPNGEPVGRHLFAKRFLLSRPLVVSTGAPCHVELCHFTLNEISTPIAA